MNRLNFVLPDFTRIAWNDVNVRKIWEPRITKIKEAWRVVESYRDTSLQFIIPELLPDLVLEMSKLGKIVIPLGKEGIGNNYSSSSIPYKNGFKFQYRVAITNRLDSVNTWIDSYRRNDDEVIGKLLSYPLCCIKFFEKYWVQEKFVDTTWVMSLFDSNTDEYKDIKLEKVDPENNILLRWLGLRLVSHLPCSFKCNETYNIAKQNKEIFKKLNLHEELEWLLELLSYEIEWTALHGIAEITTPILKIVTRTDATGEKYSVKLKGRIPDKIIEKKPLDIWTDNGFNSLEKMTEAHEDLLMVSGLKNNIKELKVLDLGCGNGILLSKIPNIIPYGVDLSAFKIKKCQGLMPNGKFTVASIYDFTWITESIFDFILLAGNRLYENPLSDILVKKLKDFANNVVIYTYEDNQDIYDIYKRYFYDWKTICGSTKVMVIQP